MGVINFLKELGWEVELSDSKVSFDLLSEKIKNRISNLPHELKQLMSSVNTLANADDTAWFITNIDLVKENDENSFAWNEFEQQSLDASLNERDKEKIIQFWESHFCFLISVKNGYSHISVVTKGSEEGKIVIGFEPEYEEVTILCDDFDEFCKIIINHINNIEVNEYLQELI
ncbi:hypothetical protein [Flavobacterium johnsoniae]|uniref:hypothetical protein n=1 Tax=Flavobacterium johnsoniae TaxID=986 RepID=UPI0011EF6E43|nr:hypothetical protein [Flavobacterium johnsoniae]